MVWAVDSRYVKTSRFLAVYTPTFGTGESANEIKIEDDDLDAVRAVIRKIYGWPIQSHLLHPWEHRLRIAKAADKYLEPEIISPAAWNMAHWGFRRIGFHGGECDIAAICEILHGFQEVDFDDEVMDCAFRLARELKGHVKDSEDFCEYPLTNPRVMLGFLEATTEHSSTVYTGSDVCDYHMETYLSRTEPGSPCPCRLNDERPTERYNMWYVKCA